MNTPTPYLLALLLILTGCSNEIGIDQELHPTDEVPVPILIVPRGIEATTKAPVDIFNNENVTNIGIYGKSDSNVIFENHPSQITDKQLLFSDHPLVYPVDNSPVTLYGYYPHTSNQGTPYTIANDLLSFTLTGEEDLMYASGKEAGSKSNTKAISLEFVHKLTNAKFKLINMTGNTLPPGKISITTEMPGKGSMDLLKGDITIDELSTTTFTLNTEIETSTLGQNVETGIIGDLLLFSKRNYSFKLMIDKQPYNIVINDTNKPAWEPGIAYQLTVTIKSLNNSIVRSSTKPTNTDENASEAIIQGTITQQQDI